MTLRHVFLPYSERGQTGYPPIGAVAVCGAVKGSADRDPVPFDHPDGCQECMPTTTITCRCLSTRRGSAKCSRRVGPNCQTEARSSTTTSRAYRQGLLWTPLNVNPGLPVRQILIWARAGGINFSPTHYCPTHEWIVVFARDGFRLKSRAASGVGDVWREPQDGDNAHPAPFPVGLPSRAIETIQPGLVLDPFMGSGTTLRAAKDAGIPAIGIELSERYCEMAVARLAQESLFGEAA